MTHVELYKAKISKLEAELAEEKAYSKKLESMLSGEKPVATKEPDSNYMSGGVSKALRDLPPLKDELIDVYEEMKGQAMEVMTGSGPVSRLPVDMEYGPSPNDEFTADFFESPGYTEEDKSFVKTVIYLLILQGFDPIEGGTISNRDLMRALKLNRLEAMNRLRVAVVTPFQIGDRDAGLNYVVPNVLEYKNQGTRAPGFYRLTTTDSVE